MDDQPLEPTVVALDAARQEQRDAVLALLGEAEAIVRGFPDVDSSDEDVSLLRDARRQVETLFMLVVVGEFNSGKSAFINALVGEPIMPEGVTPQPAGSTFSATAMRRRMRQQRTGSSSAPIQPRFSGKSTSSTRQARTRSSGSMRRFLRASSPGQTSSSS
ncbi:MAG: dynamin family protein [Thermomicrobiales bacterium]